MSDDNVFAIPTSVDEGNRAAAAFRLRPNSKWSHPGRSGTVSPASSRATTPAVEGTGITEIARLDRLVLTFDEPLKNPGAGIQFGTDPKTSDVVLGHRATRGISNQQFAIRADERLQVFLHDFSSRYGTGVGQSGQHKDDLIKHDTAFLTQPAGIPQLFETTVIKTGMLEIKITFPGHQNPSPECLANLQSFVLNSRPSSAGTSSDSASLGSLTLMSNPRTQVVSGARTPTRVPVYYKIPGIEDLGHGTFGYVKKVVRGRDGVECAGKYFKRIPKKRNFGNNEPDSEPARYANWIRQIRREVAVMRANPHANIMPVLDFEEADQPILYMPLYLDGDMSKVFMTMDEYFTAFGQILDGLVRLHAKGIAHRDLKPGNILIQRQPYLKIIIADFGMAKTYNRTQPMMTNCGTEGYAAPEQSLPAAGQTPAADIWSLGVMVLGWLYGFIDPALRPKLESCPEQKQTWNIWYVVLRNQLFLYSGFSAVDMLSEMIQLLPKDRWSARKCLHTGLQNLLFYRRPEDGLVLYDPHQSGSSSEPEELN